MKEKTFEEVVIEFVEQDTFRRMVWGMKLDAAHKRSIAAKDAKIARLKAYIAENDINGDVAVACLTEIKKSVEEKMAKIERLRALVKELSDSLYGSCKCYRPCEGCDMADESKFDCPDKALRALVARAREEVGNEN